MAKSYTQNKELCPVCGDAFVELGRHFAKEPTHRPTITKTEMDMLRGLLMGDATLRYGEDCEYPTLVVGVTEKRYLRGLQQSYPVLFNNISHQPRGGNHADLYTMSTIPHPQFYEFKNWYSSGEKVYPADLEITPTLLKHWYCTDGGLGWSSQSDYAASARIACESQDLDRIVEFFGDTPFSPSVQASKTLYFSREETPKLLGWMGPPPDGFVYKWEWNNKEAYTRKKQTTPVTSEHLSGLSEQLINVARRLEVLETERQHEQRLEEIEERYEERLQEQLAEKEEELRKEKNDELEREMREFRNQLIQDVYGEFSDMSERQLEIVNKCGGISQPMLAEAVGLSQQMISKVAN